MIAGGCTQNKPALKLVYEDGPVGATALAFDPPIIIGQAPVDLDRQFMEPTAFVGFEGPSISTYWIHTEDEMESGLYGLWGNSTRDRYRRRTIMDKTGSLYR